MLKRKEILLFFLLVTLAACNSNPLKINTSGINLTLSAERLDQDLFAVTPKNIDHVVPELGKKYGDFFSLYNLECWPSETHMIRFTTTTC
jgi:hypothetical protein